MSPVTPARASGNRLLGSLPGAELDAIAARLTQRDVLHGETIVAPWEPVAELVFPVAAVLSTMAETPEGQSVEVATIGNEGMIDPGAFLGSAVTPLHTVCQIEGPALVGKVSELVEEDGDSAFRATVLRYAHTMLVQASITASCNRLHPLEQRAGRWLLTMSDRLGRFEFPLTHEFFAIMLGAHRPSVSLAAQMLQQAGLIAYHRGQVEIRDRPGLIEASCGCYTIINDHYVRTMGIPLGNSGEA
jgi:Crp-like helix-turn-helix domain